MVGCVILAAGEGSRLRGTVARGLKPLVLVEGEPLIVRLVKQAQVVDGRTVLVVSPTNAAPIADVVEASGYDVTYVVQPEARGPADALRVGLSVLHEEHTLVLVGDNVVSDDDVRQVYDARPAIGVRHFDTKDPYLETLTRKRDGHWVEKLALSETETGIAWTGPFAVDRERALWRLQDVRFFGNSSELLIGPNFDYFFEEPPREVEVWSVDVGDGSWKL